MKRVQSVVSLDPIDQDVKSNIFFPMRKARIAEMAVPIEPKTIEALNGRYIEIRLKNSPTTLWKIREVIIEIKLEIMTIKAAQTATMTVTFNILNIESNIIYLLV